ncbi:MAG: hypothetical protein WC613_01115 [Candidatus Aenigmatarchaeota archaeon]
MSQKFDMKRYFELMSTAKIAQINGDMETHTTLKRQAMDCLPEDPVEQNDLVYELMTELGFTQISARSHKIPFESLANCISVVEYARIIEQYQEEGNYSLAASLALARGDGKTYSDMMNLFRHQEFQINYDNPVVSQTLGKPCGKDSAEQKDSSGRPRLVYSK